MVLLLLAYSYGSAYFKLLATVLVAMSLILALTSVLPNLVSVLLFFPSFYSISLLLACDLFRFFVCFLVILTSLFDLFANFTMFSAHFSL